MTGVVDKPAFSFGELLVLIDVDGVGAMSAPLPTPAEASELTRNALRGAAPCVELHGACRFRTGLAHLYAPPRADLVVSPAHVMLTISRFADEDIWKNMFEWVNGYLADTLTPTPRSAARDGYHEYAGQGVIATLGYLRPSVRLDSRDLAFLEVALRARRGRARDRATPARTRGCPDRPAGRRELARAADRLAVAPRALAPRRHRAVPVQRAPPRRPDLDREPVRGVVLALARPVRGYRAGHHNRSQVSWDLGGLGHASIVRGHGAHHRDVHELHIPVTWLAT